MIYNLLAPFEEAYKERGDQLIIEHYKLKEGIYIQIDEQGKPLQHMIIHPKEEQSELRSDQYFWFREADFYSNYLTSNKSVTSSKKIHSNNCLSVFMKKDTILGEQALSFEQIQEELSTYFETLNSEKYASEDVLSSIDGLLEVEVRQFCENALTGFFKNQMEWLAAQSDEFGIYVRVFVKRADLKDFKSEGERYLKHKIFNTEAYNITHNNELFGLSDMNMGMNSKKPYLEHKSTPFEAPFRIELDTALLLHKYAIWVKNQKYGSLFVPQAFAFDRSLERENIKSTGSDMHYLFCGSNNDQLEIRDFDIVPAHSKKIEFEVRNTLSVSVYDKESETWRMPYYGEYNTNSVEAFFKGINELLFDNQLKDNLTKEPKELKVSKFMGKRLLVNLLNTRDAIFNFINKGDFLSLQHVVGQHFRDLMIDMTTKSRSKGQEAFNCYVACLKTFNLGGDSLENNLKHLSHEMRLAVELKNNEDLNHSDLYAYMAGQVAYFVICQSEKKKMNHDVIEHFLNKETTGDLNEELKYWYKKYSHAISLKKYSFNRALGKLMAFDNKSTFNEDLFLAGFLSNNLFFEKKGDGENEEE